jgi:hypothetical protein
MQTRQFLPALKEFFFGSNKVAPVLGDTNGGYVQPEQKEKQPCLESLRCRQKMSRPHGRKGMRNGKPVRQILTNVKHMHRSQRARFAKGETIYV